MNFPINGSQNRRELNKSIIIYNYDISRKLRLLPPALLELLTLPFR